MTYLSQLINKTIYYENKPYGKVIDMAVFENRPQPYISKVSIKRGEKKLTISPQAVAFKNNRFTLVTKSIPLLPYDHQDFYLYEDLLDKQVIDTDGKRLVRVNDVILDNNAELKVIGIDVGIAGILRRLGLTKIGIQPRIIPWRFIEAFDYQTGNIKVKLSQHSLQSLHPADIADILEEAGTKERIGILSSLDTKQAARVIEASDEQTQVSLVEELANTPSKAIINRMRSSELADVFHFLNPLKVKEIQKLLSVEKAQRVKEALSYADDVAGGLMRLSYFMVDGGKTVKETRNILQQRPTVPEVIIVSHDTDKFSGTVLTKDLVRIDSLAILKDIITEKKFVYSDVHISTIFKVFFQYTLRALPVIDKDKKILGLIVLDDMLHIAQQQDQRYETV